jgi:pimeloyl-ACP methyl ester carboxylesterase
VSRDLARPVLVLHDFGAEDAGRPWRDAFDGVGWPGRVLAPDLPGHGQTPAPLGGNYEYGDAVFFVLPLLRELAPGPAPVVVGVGLNGSSAQVLAVGGRASSLVLVDGVGGPWRTPREGIRAQRETLRAISADPHAMAPPPASGLDPRTRAARPGGGSRSFAETTVAALSVPTLVLESPGSPLPLDDVRDLFRGAAAAEVFTIAEPDPKEVARIVTGWAAALA